MSTSEVRRPRSGATAPVGAQVGARVGALAAGVLLLAGCSTAAGEPDTAPVAERVPAASSSAAPSSAPSSGARSQSAPTPSATPEPEPTETPEPPAYVVSDGRPRDAVMRIPDLDVEGLRVEAYTGVTDDAAGHAIQNTGIAASPHGPDEGAGPGGVGPGGVGNYQVTGHRNSAGGIFLALPELDEGDQVVVTAGGTDYVYRITTTRITSFRSEASLREQRAAVPGRPGATPTRAMITISTCRTQEDHDEGNFWSDEFDNPENRIDKIGVLVRTRPA